MDVVQEYVATHFLSTDEAGLAWAILSEEDQKVLLTRSFEAIESLPLLGCRTVESQANAFPRWPDTEVPLAVQYAQIENAVSLAKNTQSEDERFYDSLRAHGVASYSIGNLSETLNDSTKYISQKVEGIISDRAIKLLQPFISGGYRISGGKR